MTASAPTTSGARWMRDAAQLEAGRRDRVEIERAIQEAADRAGLPANTPLIYVLQPARYDAPVKIGYARSIDHLSKRVRDLQRSSPDLLLVRRVLAGTPADERRLHARFRDAWWRGEWFACTPDLERFVSNETPIEGETKCLTTST